MKSFFGPRIPRPLEIAQHYGDSTLKSLSKEIIALTRLDWNTTRYSLSIPITLKFSRRVGKILAIAKPGEKLRINIVSICDSYFIIGSSKF